MAEITTAAVSRRVRWALTAVLGCAVALGASLGSTTAVRADSSQPSGYDLVASDGGIFPFGNAVGYGSTGNVRLNQPVVGMANTPDYGGYWLVAADGGVFPFGNAAGYGSTGNIRLNQPMVGMASTHDGRGYWLVAADGGVFPFGDAVGYGSTGNLRLNRPVVGMAATPDGRGYWLVAADGGIFPFGDAVGYGSTGGIVLNKPVVGMAATFTGAGYWLVASDGGIFPFGDARGYGSTGNVRLNQPVVGMDAVPTGGGYWLVAADGGIFPFGPQALGYGSTGNVRLNKPMVGMAGTGRVIYAGPVRYTNPCNGPNSSVTYMDANGTQQACQTSSNGGYQLTHRNCAQRGRDDGAFTYTPSGPYAQPGNPTYTGSYSLSYVVTPGYDGPATYSGREYFVDQSGGTLTQTFSTPVTFDSHCNPVPVQGGYSVRVYGTGDLAFLSGSAGRANRNTSGAGTATSTGAWFVPVAAGH